MPARKPLVIIDGQVQNLSGADTLDAPITNAQVVTLTNDELSPLVIGTPVYIDAADGAKKAQSNASGTSNVFALWKDASTIAAASGQAVVDGILVATTTQWDVVTGDAGGLAFGAVYYLDPTIAGRLTDTAPTSSGQYVVRVGTAKSTTELMVDIEARILL